LAPLGDATRGGGQRRCGTHGSGKSKKDSDVGGGRGGVIARRGKEKKKGK